MQQKSATTKIKGGIMKTLSNPLLNRNEPTGLSHRPEWLC